MKQKEIQIPKFAQGAATLYHIPASKSVLARDIVLLHRFGKDADKIRRELLQRFGSEDLSGDIEVLLRALSTPVEHDCGESGTALRFLTAYLSSKKGKHLIKGSPRLKERPIEGLCKVLETSGVRFTFLEKMYAVPFITNNPIGDLHYPKEIDARDFPSSQYLSALRLAGCPSAFILGDDFPSLPYFRLTEARLERFGKDWDRIGDWSSAWYWIEDLLLQPTLKEVVVSNLSLSSGQPDEELFHKVKGFFGIEAIQTPEGVTFRKTRSLPLTGTRLTIDIAPYPDQFLTLGCICLGLGLEFEALGTARLSLKESDRVLAFAENIRHLFPGTDTLLEVENNRVYIKAGSQSRENVILDGFNDHRVVMSFAVLAASPHLDAAISITDPEVVTKSYPAFWENLLPNPNS